ncbi:MAG: AMP nucleosidase [Candidatus Omnitrophica bacterium]|nr:AMP nucleosidase [Candidatus Omnitrophota bacterium]
MSQVITDEKNRQVVALGMLERYTGSTPKEFFPHILLTNFDYYFNTFADNYQVRRKHGAVMEVAHAVSEKISMINFRIGAPTAGLVIDILSYINPKAVLMLGMCGGLHPKVKVGEFVLPMAAIRDEGTSQFYMPSQVPALPTFRIQKILSEVLGRMKVSYKTGVVHTTDYRFWEFDSEFREKLKQERAIGIEMECSSLFVAGFRHKTPIGALLLVSDLPLIKGGIKSHKSSESVYKRFADVHLGAGFRTLKAIQSLKEGINLRQFQW